MDYLHELLVDDGKYVDTFDPDALALYTNTQFFESAIGEGDGIGESTSFVAHDETQLKDESLGFFNGSVLSPRLFPSFFFFFQPRHREREEFQIMDGYPHFRGKKKRKIHSARLPSQQVRGHLPAPCNRTTFLHQMSPSAG